MKKLISSLIAMLLCMSYFSVASVADGVAPKDGTATPYGIYGVVEDIGVNPNSNPLTRSALFGAEIRLDPGKSFTSYQYEVKSSCTRVGMTSTPTNVKHKISLYGSNTIGGSKTLIGSMTSSTSGVAKEYNNNYRYYNVVVKNIGSSSGVNTVGIYAD